MNTVPAEARPGAGRLPAVAMALVLAVPWGAAPAAKKQPPPDGRSVAELLAALADELPYRRKQAARALGAKGAEALPAVLKALKHKDWRVRRAAADALAEMGPEAAGKAVGPLVEALGDRHAWVRAGAAGALGKMGTLPTEAAKALARACSDPDKWVREYAMGALPAATKDKDLLLRTATAVIRLPDSGWGVRRHAMSVLRRYGEGYKPAGDALVEMLRRPSEGMWDCSGPAVELLIGLGRGKEVVPILVGWLGRKNRGVPRNAAALLGKIGRDAAPALPALRKMAAESEDRSYRQVAAKAVEAIEAALGKEGGK